MDNFGKLNFSVSFNPTSAFPVDARYYFDTLEAAQTAAKSAVPVGSSDGTYFYGMNLVVVGEGLATLYLINPDKTLKPVGVTLVGDNKTVKVSPEGTISLFGVDEESAVTGSYPTLMADGSIKWVKPDTSTVEGLTQEVNTLGERVDAAEEEIEKVKADLAGVFHFKGDADSFDGTNIILGGKPITDMKQGDVYQVGDKEYAYTGTEWIELGFNIDLSGYAKKADVDNQISAITGKLDKKVDAEEGKGLSSNDFTDDLKAKLGIAEENIIDGITIAGKTIAPNENKIVDVPMATTSALGVVKSAASENGVTVKPDGAMEVNSINVNKLTQTEGDTIVLDGGSSIN